MLGAIACIACVWPLTSASTGVPDAWANEWPHTKFDTASVDFAEIRSGGPPRDGIPALLEPRFRTVAAVDELEATEPVIVVELGEVARAYPVRILMWHEIANDTIDGRPIVVTYCPLCNASLVYDRQVMLDGKEHVLTFGVSGKLRHSDMIMYDHQTESWWQQFTGDAIVGVATGTRLARISSQTVPFATFAQRHPQGLVLDAPPDSRRRYGMNPYVRYDGGKWPMLYDGRYEGPVPPLSYVVVVGNEAWPLERVRQEREVRHGSTVISWQPGMNSALDSERIAAGRDVGFVQVRQAVGDRHHPLPYDVTFAFAFKAFIPDGTIHHVE